MSKARRHRRVTLIIWSGFQEQRSTAVEPGLFDSRRDHLDGLLPQESAHFLFHYQSLLGTHQRGSAHWKVATERCDSLFYSVLDPSRHIWQ